MDVEQIKQLANDVNNVATTSFQSGKEYAASSLLTEIEQLRTQRHRLLSTIQNALVSLAIINMPVQEDNLANIATNDDLLKVMADSFRRVIAEMENSKA